jgi:hypothetical protein
VKSQGNKGETILQIEKGKKGIRNHERGDKIAENIKKQKGNIPKSRK